MTRAIWFFLAATFGAAATPLWGNALIWDAEVKKISADAGCDQVDVGYDFQNRSTHPVVILSLSTSCGCTVAKLDKTTYAPGERGIVKATFKPGERVGLQEKTVTVQTADPSEAPTVLTLVVNLREYAALTPTVLFWSTKGPNLEQRIACSATETNAINLLSVWSDNPNFVLRLETVQRGRQYNVYVKPRALTPDDHAAVTVKVQAKGGPLRTLTAYGYIK